MGWYRAGSNRWYSGRALPDGTRWYSGRHSTLPDGIGGMVQCRFYQKVRRFLPGRRICQKVRMLSSEMASVPGRAIVSAEVSLALAVASFAVLGPTEGGQLQTGVLQLPLLPQHLGGIDETRAESRVSARSRDGRDGDYSRGARAGREQSPVARYHRWEAARLGKLARRNN